MLSWRTRVRAMGWWGGQVQALGRLMQHPRTSPEVSCSLAWSPACHLEIPSSLPCALVKPHGPAACGWASPHVLRAGVEPKTVENRGFAVGLGCSRSICLVLSPLHAELQVLRPLDSEQITPPAFLGVHLLDAEGGKWSACSIAGADASTNCPLA